MDRRQRNSSKSIKPEPTGAGISINSVTIQLNRVHQAVGSIVVYVQEPVHWLIEFFPHSGSKQGGNLLQEIEMIRI